MDWQMQDSTPQIAPLLVRLYDRHKLYALAKDTDESSRSELAAVMVDLLSIRLTARETELITDVLVGLVRQAEIDLRRALAERLSTMDNVPLRMVLHLANDHISVAEKVLRDSPVLQDMDLIYIVKSNGSDHWQAIAQRKMLGGVLINLLSEMRDVPTAIMLAENQYIKLTPQAIKSLTDLARENEKLAKPLLKREDIPDHIAREIYKFVGQEIKSHILDHFNAHKPKIAAELEDAIVEFVVKEDREYFPTTYMISAAERLQKKGLLSFPHMMVSLRQGLIASFIAQFSIHFGLSQNYIYEAITQESGRTLATICRGLNVAKPDFMSIFLLTIKARSHGGSIVEPKHLVMALRHFDETDIAASQKLIASLRH
ncbi:MAG: DUF2336 domain-containing protein [Alphaproteobacteria bacterium]|nr:DUF2336 domain-containing protein [Alphaproteobacteria bacterium]